MGNFVSKCCRRDVKKYKEDNGIGKAIQPEQNDPGIPVQIATNKGAKKEEPNRNTNDKTETRERKEENETGVRMKHTADDGDKKPSRKHRQRKHSTSDDSSDFLTSSSSDSSESDSDGGYVKSNKKVYKNKGGGTTIISKKTIMTGNKMIIGENARNLTINIGSNSTPQTVTQDKSTKPGRYEEKPFQSYYSDSNAKEEEKRQYASPWGRNMRPPGGNFIDSRDIHIKDYVFESSVRVDAARWVCMICCPGGTGTGFRVGTKYIMTAKHVVDCILKTGYQQIGQPAQPSYSRLQDAGVYAVFDFMTEGQQISDRQRFRFKDVVHFMDSLTDTAVLELEDNTIGTPMPLSFTYFSLPQLNNRFSLIGHPEGKRMQFNSVDKIIDMNSTETQRDIVQVKQSSLQHTGRDYEFPPHNVLTNPHRYLFHCKFTKGASGSPGVVVLDDGRVVVVTMLVCGLPDWYYNISVSDDLKNSWQKTHCIEQGVNFKSVYEHMQRDNHSLCSEIFFGHTDTIPNPTIK